LTLNSLTNTAYHLAVMQN